MAVKIRLRRVGAKKAPFYRVVVADSLDTWYQQLQRGNYISVRNFEDYLRILLGMPPTSCASSGSCGHYLTVEGDGSLYPCDFYVLDEWKLGNLLLWNL